jgi:hypothetical protein
MQQPLEYETPQSPGARRDAAPVAWAYTLIVGGFLAVLLAALLLATLHEFALAWLVLGAAGFVGLALGLWRVVRAGNEWWSALSMGLLCGAILPFYAAVNAKRSSAVLMQCFALILVLAGMVAAALAWRQRLAKVVLVLGALLLIFGAWCVWVMTMLEGFSRMK